MQTFLPYKDFHKSAKVLDNKRLGKQRVEALQILQTLKKGDTAKGWKNHPAVKMWKGYENALIEYGIAICDEWRNRGFKDTVREKLWNQYPWHQVAPRPDWIGNRKFHSSHRSNLLRKDPVFYGRYNWSEPNDLPYVCPK